MRIGAIFILLFVFGIPFLLISDWFPLHRFGMFARIPVSIEKQVQFRIVTLQSGTWKSFETGNAYFDQSYTSLWAKRAWNEDDFRKKLSGLIRAHSDSSIKEAALEKFENHQAHRLSLWKR